MKFKKVEIQAFRAYNEVSDGTFDFNIGKDQSADLVGIYAPNGFGKTSFYDAVEWGVTKNIHRLLKKHKFNIEHAKSERNINSKAKQYILRNRFAKDETPGYVQLYTTNLANPIKRDIDVPKKGGVDYKFKDSDTINGYFQKVILSQEWIDAFLKEDDSVERYETFMEYFGNKQLDDYRKKLVELITANDKQIADLKDKLKGVQKELDFNGDQNILQNLNTRITALQPVYPHLSIIETEFTETDFVNFKNQLTELLQQLNNHKSAQSSQMEKLNKALNGDKLLLGIEDYDKSKNELTNLLLNIKQLNDLQEDFKTRVTNENKHKDNLKEQANLSNKQKGIDRIAGKLSAYFHLDQERNKNIDQTKIKQEELRKNEKLSQDAQSNLKALELQQKSLQKTLRDIDLQLRTAADKRNDQETYESVYAKLSQDAANAAALLNSVLKESIEQQNQIDRLKAAIKDANDDKFPPTDYEAYQKYRATLRALSTGKDGKERLQKEINELNKAITERETFNQEIQRFITLGAAIVDKDQLSVCPLCSHNHEEYQILARQIAGNSLLSDALQSLLTQKTKLEQAAGETETSFKKNKTDLIEALTKERTDAEKKLEELRPREIDSIQAKKTAEDAIQLLNKARLEFSSLLGPQTYESYRESLIKRLNDTQKLLDNLKDQITTSQRSVRDRVLDIDITNAELKTLATQLKSLNSDEIYREVVSFFEKNHPGITPEKKLLDDQSTQVKEQLETLKSQLIRLQDKKKALDKKLDGHRQDAINNELQKLTTNQENLERNIKIFENFVKKECRIEIIKRVNFEDGLIGLHQLLTDDDTLINEFLLIQQQLDNILPYLRFEKAKVSFDKLKARISFLENTLNKELEKERKKVGEHLHDEIKAFFYEDLINDLYSKIDPHPEYKKIKFMCDFKEEKPKLNVCVCTEGKDELLIPNLYFSTAQLNILSLSIFLAKALNVQDDQQKPVDCIFIDDPIQSMDSINILSTIDLLRSLVVNYEKQIIISTHDENFYNLLQKKIPSGLFKSKFIELETFGKVKAAVN